MPGSLAVRLSPPVWVAWVMRARHMQRNITPSSAGNFVKSFPAPRLRPGRGLGRRFLDRAPTQATPAWPSSHFSLGGAPTQPARQDGREGKWGDWGANKLQKLAN